MDDKKTVTKPKLYTIFIIQCYFQKTDDGQLLDNVVAEIIANSEEEAMKKTKAYIKKPFYRLASIIEKYV